MKNHPEFDEHERRRLFGKTSIRTLNENVDLLMTRIGEGGLKSDPDTNYESRSRQVQFFEEGIHELAHHVCLRSSAKLDRSRDISIGNEIDNLTPLVKDANELDALAVELNTAWWLQVPIRERTLVRAATVDGNVNYFTFIQALRLVRELRVSKTNFRLGFELALAVKNAKAL